MQGNSDRDPELLDAAALVGHPVAEGSVYAFLAEHRRRLIPDELFAGLFPTRRGRPSVPADVVATVMLLQLFEGLWTATRSRRCAPICAGRSLQPGVG